MKRLLITLSALFCAGISFAQSVTKTHVVDKGETITQIAKKYHTTNNVLFLLNPEAVDGISERQVLKIPVTSDIQHKVETKETVYGISKKYNVPIEKLYDLNPGLKENGLKIGQMLNLTEATAQSNSGIETQSQSTGTITVGSGDTIYGIAVKNNTTVSVLYELNPDLRESGLKTGQTVKIPSGAVSSQETNAKNSLENPAQTPKTITVKPKETLYNITKTHNISQEQLLRWNPALRSGLKEGDTLIVGYENASEKADKNTIEDYIEKNVDLTLSNDGAVRELVFLLPFNTAVNNFSEESSVSRKIKSDVFLNMTLEFYSGAKLAVEELKSKNYPLNIRFVDSRESNRSLDINTLKSDFDFTSTDVIIGPFYQKNVDAVSETFKNQQTIIVSPLSTDKGKPYPHQVHTMPTGDIVKKEMLEYLKSKQQQIIAVTDGVKTPASYFKANYPEVHVLSVGKDEKVGSASLRNLLSSGVKNYIVYDARSLTTSVELMGTLKMLQQEFDIQLVGLERNEVLESSDINIDDLIALQYMFPSVTNDADSQKKNSFTTTYKSTYGKTPTRFATRGYDVTYDVITRMFESEENSNIFDYGSQQVENKFAYINENGGVYNNAVYILYYDNDLTIKEAK